MSLLVGELMVKLELDSSTFTKALKAAEAELRNVAKNLKPEVFIDVKVKEQASINALKQQITQAQTSVHGLSSSFTGLGSIMRNALSVSIGSLLTQPLQQLLSIFPNVIGGAANFEQGLSNVAAVAGGLTANELEGLRQKALQIGADTSLSATQATQAFEALVANGVEVNSQFNEIADSTVALSEATGSDLTTAANVATDVINNFAGAGDNLKAVVDGITGVTVAGKFQINDYALALANGGVATAGMGVSLTDFNAVIAATSSAFKSGQTAGTSFRMFVNALTPSTKGATQAMKELGLITADGSNVFYDSQGNLRSQVEIFAALESAMGSLTEAQYAQYSQTIFGAEGADFLTAALNVGSDGLQRYADNIAKVSSADIAATRLDNFKGAVEQLKGSLDTAGITIGSFFLPALKDIAQSATAGINALVNIINAVDGSKEAFNNLSPVLQMVVVAIQEMIEYVQAAIDALSGAFQNAINDITSFFSDLVSMAYGWGANIGDEFGSGILASLGSVVSAVQEMGSILEYWMAPGSPPRMAPDLDKWGRAVGTVYADEIANADISGLKKFGSMITSAMFSGADLDSIKTFTDEVTSVINSMVSSEQMSESDGITAILGTKESFAEALSQLKTTGGISTGVFGSIIDNAGNAGEQVIALASTFFSLEQASLKTATAQNALAQSQQKLSSVQQALRNATQGYRNELEKIKKEQELLDINQQIKDQTQLANAIGGDGSVQAKAQKELIRLSLERAIIQKELEFQPAIDAAEQEIIAAESALDVAKEQERIEQEKYDLVRQQINAQIEQNKLIKEQLDLAKKSGQEKGGGGGGGGAKTDAIDKDKQAQDAYNYSLEDTDGKLAILKQRLAGVKEGSAEYYQLLGQIGQLENTQAKEQEKIALDAQKQAEEKVKAERDYQYSIADTKGKLAILRAELGNVEQGSAEYYKILKDINQLEKSESKAAKGGGSGLGGIPKKEDKPKEDSKAVQDIRKKFADQKLAAEEARTATQAYGGSLDTARTALMNLKSAMQPFIDIIQANLVPILAGVATPAIIALGGALLTGLGGAFAALLSPIALISFAVAALVLAWQTNFGNIQGMTDVIFNNIKIIISNVLSAIQVFWDAHGTEVMSTVNTIFNALRSIVITVMQIIGSIINQITGKAADDTDTNFTQLADVAYAIFTAVKDFIIGTLAIIQGVLNVVLAAINGDWNKFWNDLDHLARTFLAVILKLITDQITIIATLFGVKTEDMKVFWDTLGSNLQTATSDFTSFITKTVTEGLAGASKLFETAKTNISSAWDKLKSLLPESTRSALGGVSSALTSMIEGIKTAAVSIGSGIIDGIKKGITAGLSGLKEAAKSVANAAIQAAKDVLKIQSPSKVMMQVGTDFTKGFSMGALDESVPMMKSIDSMMQSTIPTLPSMSPAMAGGSINNYYDFTIDARGSQMTENQFKTIIKDEVNKLSERGNNRGRR